MFFLAPYFLLTMTPEISKYFEKFYHIQLQHTQLGARMADHNKDLKHVGQQYDDQYIELFKRN